MKKIFTLILFLITSSLVFGQEEISLQRNFVEANSLSSLSNSSTIFTASLQPIELAEQAVEVKNLAIDKTKREKRKKRRRKIMLVGAAVVVVMILV